VGIISGTSSGTTSGSISGITSGTVAGSVSGTNTGVTTGTNSGTVAGVISGTISGTNTGTVSGTNTGTVVGTVSGTNTGTTSGTTSGSTSGSTSGTTSGTNAGNPIDGDNVASEEDERDKRNKRARREQPLYFLAYDRNGQVLWYPKAYYVYNSGFKLNRSEVIFGSTANYPQETPAPFTIDLAMDRMIDQQLQMLSDSPTTGSQTQPSGAFYRKQQP
jgi:uncharacterized protein YcfJ